jgi:hypothetical protein
MQNGRVRFIVPEIAPFFPEQSSTSVAMLSSVKALKKLKEMIDGHNAILLSDSATENDVKLSFVRHSPNYTRFYSLILIKNLYRH